MDTEHGEGWDALISTVLYSWYWWMYACNFVIYVATNEDFRDIYTLFLGDLLGAGSGRWRQTLFRRN